MGARLPAARLPGTARIRDAARLPGTAPRPGAGGPPDAQGSQAATGPAGTAGPASAYGPAIASKPVSGHPPWEPITASQSPAGPPGDGLRPSSRRRRRGGWWTALPYLAVLATVGTGLWWTWLSAQRVRGGSLAIAGALFVAALARLVLPEEWAGMLASRRRLIDVVTLVALACGLLAAGLVLPTSS